MTEICSHDLLRVQPPEETADPTRTMLKYARLRSVVVSECKGEGAGAHPI